MSAVCTYCNREFKSPRSLQVHQQGCRAYLGESRYAEYCRQRSHKKSDEQKAAISIRYTGSGNPFYGKKHTTETKSKISKAEKGCIWINNGEVEHQISQHDLSNYPGFSVGRLLTNVGFRGNKSMLGKIWITNGSDEIPIVPSELEDYLRLGYYRGRSPRTKQRSSETRLRHIREGKYIMPYNGIKSCKSYLDGKLLKSSYEFIYAIWLEANKIPYKYEPFKLKTSIGRTYTPDFLLLDTNLVVEVKGRNDKAMLAKLGICEEAVINSGYSYQVIHGDKIWNKYYPDLVSMGYNIGECLDILHKDNQARKSNKSKPYLSWVIDNKHITVKEVD